MGQSHSRQQFSVDPGIAPTENVQSASLTVFHATQGPFVSNQTSLVHSGPQAQTSAASSLASKGPDAFEGDDGVSRPAPRPNLFRVSELIDPHDLLTTSGLASIDEVQECGIDPKASFSALPDVNKRLPPLVQSPAGNILGTAEFLMHPERPLAIRERQESIKRALETAQWQEEEARNSSPERGRSSSSARKRSWSRGRKRSKASSRKGSDSSEVSPSGSSESVTASRNPSVASIESQIDRGFLRQRGRFQSLRD